MDQRKKEKEKEMVCLWQEAIYIYFLSHRHVVLSRGSQWNRRKLSECSNPWKIFYSPLPTKSDIFIGSQKHGSTARSGISDQSDLSNLHWVPKLWQLPRLNISDPRSDISDPSDLFGLHRVSIPCHPPRSDISKLHQIYLTQPKLSHFKFPIGHIRSRSDISDGLTPLTVINVWGL
jgi:hypothetical protein